jgi:hypothetical protein
MTKQLELISIGKGHVKGPIHEIMAQLASTTTAPSMATLTFMPPTKPKTVKAVIFSAAC